MSFASTIARNIDCGVTFRPSPKIVWPRQGQKDQQRQRFPPVTRAGTGFPRLSVYDKKPERFLEHLHRAEITQLSADLLCAGYELGRWRCEAFAFHLAEWLPDYALPEEELSVNHANSSQRSTRPLYASTQARSTRSAARQERLPCTPFVATSSARSRYRLAFFTNPHPTTSLRPSTWYMPAFRKARR
jgi:hypothetical protein